MLVLLSHSLSVAIGVLIELYNNTPTFLNASALWIVPSCLNFIGFFY